MMRCYDLRMDLCCMANLLDNYNFVNPDCVFAWNFGCVVVQTLCVLTFDLVGSSQDLTRIRLEHCSWLADLTVVWCAVIVYIDNLRCLTVVMTRGCIPA